MTTNDNHYGERIAKEEQSRNNLLPEPLPANQHHNLDPYATPGSAGTKERRRLSLDMLATMIIACMVLSLALLSTSLPMFLKLLLCAPIAFMVGACIHFAISGRYTDSNK